MTRNVDLNEENFQTLLRDLKENSEKLLLTEMHPVD